MDLKGKRRSTNVVDKRNEGPLAGMGKAFTNMIGDIRYGTKKNRALDLTNKRWKGEPPPVKKFKPKAPKAPTSKPR